MQKKVNYNLRALLARSKSSCKGRDDGGHEVFSFKFVLEHVNGRARRVSPGNQNTFEYVRRRKKL